MADGTIARDPLAPSQASAPMRRSSMQALLRRKSTSRTRNWKQHKAGANATARFHRLPISHRHFGYLFTSRLGLLQDFLPENHYCEL